MKDTALKGIYRNSVVMPSFLYQQQKKIGYIIQDLLASLDMNYCCPIKLDAVHILGLGPHLTFWKTK